MITISAMAMTAANSKNPMALLITILVNSFLVAYLAFKHNMETWTGVLILMVYVSGVMVLFMYIVSLSSSNTESEKGKKLMLILSSVALGLFMWSGALPPLKEMGKFSQSFEKQMNAILILIVMMLIMASIIPNISLTSFKGLKASN